jgi:hypothetical protein
MMTMATTPIIIHSQPESISFTSEPNFVQIA